MLPKELYSKIQKLHFRTRFLANDLFAGQYLSAFKGRGMEFAEVREYQVGDDVRDIDWNVSARFGHPFVKIFHEERELTVVLALDLSGSNRFGTQKRFKREVIAEAAGLLSFLAIRTNDRVGAILFSDKVDKFIPPQKGAGHVWLLIKEIFSFEPPSRMTDVGAALVYLNKVVKRHAIVFLISDFLIKDPEENLEGPLMLSSKKHDVTALRVRDPAERTLPKAGFVRLKDPETGTCAMINTHDAFVRRQWNRIIATVDDAFSRVLKKSQVPLVELTTDGSVVEPLTAFFHHRGRHR
jgi:uncharacterized protein (DUF58 family)